VSCGLSRPLSPPATTLEPCAAIRLMSTGVPALLILCPRWHMGIRAIQPSVPRFIVCVLTRNSEGITPDMCSARSSSPAPIRIDPGPEQILNCRMVNPGVVPGRRSARGRRPHISVAGLASRVDPNLASTCDRVVLSSNDPQPHDQAQRHSEGGQEGGRIGVVPCGWSLGWRHADRDQFGPRIRLR
jgi:hypothetical protein